MEENEKRVLLRLQGQCARREYCVKDVAVKAVKLLEGDTEAAERVLASLIEDKFVDDRRYASAFAREKASLSGWGPVKIKFALSAKGVSAQAIEEALADVDSGKADEKMTAVLTSKYKALEGDPQRRLKFLKFALSRGYEYDKVAAELKSIETV